MTRARATRWLGWTVGVIFIVLGIVEVTVRLVSDEPIDPSAMAWWSLSLIGGGTLVLLGSFVIKAPGIAFATLALGCLVGILATMWTVLIPILAISLVVLSGMSYGAQAPSSVH